MVMLCLFWITFLAFTQSFTSGFHFIDDHEIIILDSKIESTSFAYTAKSYMMRDLGLRFRPFWAVYRVAEVALFGRNITAWSVYLGLLGIATSLLLYRAVRLAGLGIAPSALCVLLTFMNPAAVIWCQLADSESIGMFMLSLSLYLGMKAIHSGSAARILYQSGFAASLMLTALCKESFILAVPAIVYFCLWIYSAKRGTGFLEAFRRNAAYAASPLIFSALCILFIVMHTGIAGTGYAGVKEDLLSFGSIAGMAATAVSFGIFIAVLLMAVMYFFYRSRTRRSRVEDGLRPSRAVIFSLLIIIPQIILYHESTIWARYFVPLMLGYSFILTFLLSLITGAGEVPAPAKFISTAICIAVLAYQTYSYAYPDVMLHNSERRSMTAMLNNLKTCADTSSTVLVVMDPVHHWGYGRSLFTYFEYADEGPEMRFDFTKLDTIIQPYDDTAFYRMTENYTEKFFSRHMFDTSFMQTPSCVALFPGLEPKFNLKYNLLIREGEYFRHDHNGFVVLDRNDSEPE